jgi:hypothetical protein
MALVIQSVNRGFKAGKVHDSYYTNNDIIWQAKYAMDILETQDFSKDNHVLVFDNASNYLKCANNALSAQKMPKGIPKVGTNWGIKITQKDENGQPIYVSNNKVQKMKIKMGPSCFSDGSPQDLYFPNGHKHAGIFKGMAIILQEHGFGDMSKVCAECSKFKCKPGASDCCCRQILCNQPNFINVPSLLEAACKSCGFRIIFLPNFHCKLSFIEQC